MEIELTHSPSPKDRRAVESGMRAHELSVLPDLPPEGAATEAPKRDSVDARKFCERVGYEMYDVLEDRPSAPGCTISKDGWTGDPSAIAKEHGSVSSAHPLGTRLLLDARIARMLWCLATPNVFAVATLTAPASPYS